jgi:hypothetical protein
MFNFFDFGITLSYQFTIVIATGIQLAECMLSEILGLIYNLLTSLIPPVELF